MSARFIFVDNNMKVHTNELFRQFVSPKPTSICPPPKMVNTESTLKKDDHLNGQLSDHILSLIMSTKLIQMH